MTVSLLPKWLIFVKKALQFSKFDLTKLHHWPLFKRKRWESLRQGSFYAKQEP